MVHLCKHMIVLEMIVAPFILKSKWEKKILLGVLLAFRWVPRVGVWDGWDSGKDGGGWIGCMSLCLIGN